MADRRTGDTCIIGTWQVSCVVGSCTIDAGHMLRKVATCTADTCH